MSNQWRKRQNNSNPFLSSRAQESSEQTLQEISKVNPEFAKHRSASNGTKPSNNPYLDSTLYDAQHKYGPDANSQFMAHHGIREEHKTHDAHSNGGHATEHRNRRDDGRPNHHEVAPSSTERGRPNRDHDAKSQAQYVRGKLSDLQLSDKDTVTVRDDNPYHPSNFYTEHKDRNTVKELVSSHRKYPKATVPPKKGRTHNQHTASSNGHPQHRADKVQKAQNAPNAQNGHIGDVLDEMDSFFETVEAADVRRDDLNDGHDPYDHGFFVDPHDAEMDAQVRAQYGYGDEEYGHFAGDAEQDRTPTPLDGDDEDVAEDEEEESEHFRQFMADPEAQCPLSPHSVNGGDSNCIEGCERITPSNFHSLKAGDIVSILMENLWTYYKVVSNERNGDDFVAKFESGFASKEESVFIKDGVIAQFVTVWGEQSADQIAICREMEGGDGKEEERELDIVENGWIKLEEDGFTKLHLVVAYEANGGSGKALLKAMGSDVERVVDLNACAYKVL